MGKIPLSELLEKASADQDLCDLYIFRVISAEKVDGRLTLYVPAVLKKALRQYDPLLKRYLGDFTIVTEKRSVQPSSRKEEAKKVPREVKVPATGRILGDPLNPEMTMGKFIVSSNNEDAHSAVNEVLKKSGSTSVLVFGLPGVGKTHLLQAAGWKALYSGIDIAHFSSNTLIKLLLNSFKARNTYLLVEKLASAKVLLIDDFQQFNSRNLGKVFDVLFYLLDGVLMRGGKVIVTSDTKTREWKHVHQRIVQRLKLYGEIPIRIPDSEFARAFFRNRLPGASDAVIEHLSKVPFENIRALASVADILKASTEGREITMTDANMAVKMVFGSRVTLSETSLKTRWRDFLISMGQFDGHDLKAILEKKDNRLPIELKKQVSMLRAVFASAAREKGYSTRAIAEALGVVPRYVPGLIRRKESFKGNPDYERVKKMVKEIF